MRLLISFLILFPVVVFGQIQSKWTTIEIGEADVARSINDISDFDKDVILYHNLVRLYPIKYLKVEILNLNEDLESVVQNVQMVVKSPKKTNKQIENKETENDFNVIFFLQHYSIL